MTATHTPGQDIYVKLIRPEDYGDVDEWLLLEDAHIHPAFQPEIVTTEILALREQRDELLAALEALDLQGEWSGTRWTVPAEVWRQARAAIAKARGA